MEPLTKTVLDVGTFGTTLVWTFHWMVPIKGVAIRQIIMSSSSCVTNGKVCIGQSIFSSVSTYIYVISFDKIHNNYDFCIVVSCIVYLLSTLDVKFSFITFCVL